MGDKKTKKVRGATILIDCIKAEGVDLMFGYPGGAVLEIYDEIYKSDIRHILTRHEQASIHAAEGYAKSTGKVGVCIATSGPGATNLVTGLTDAYMDSVPIVAITGQVITPLIGKDGFQEADTFGITMPVVKHSYQIRNIDDIPQVVKDAFYIASHGRPGPVLIDIPKDITINLAEFAGPAKAPSERAIRSQAVPVTDYAAQLEEFTSLLSESQRPVLYIGGGVIISQAQGEVTKFAEKFQIPVTYTLMGKGAFDDDNPLCLRMLGMHGTAYANYAVSESDLLIAVGARFDDRVTGKLSTFASKAKIVHIDIDAAEIGKNITPDISFRGDAKDIMKLFNEKISDSYRPLTKDWLERIRIWKDKYPLDPAAHKISHIHILKEINDLTNKDCIVATDVGQHQMWAAQYIDSKPHNWLTSGGLGTMGFGFPAAIGAKLARPDAHVFCVTGDGSFQMNLQELGTVAAEEVPVIICILNNRFLGMVRQWQELFYDKRYSFVDIAKGQPDFVKLAEAYGLAGEKIEHAKDVRGAIERALKSKRTTILEFCLELEESVYPMVPAGGAIHQMVGLPAEGERFDDE